MNKRVVIGLVIGMSLLFYVTRWFHQENIFVVEANTEAVVDTSEPTEQHDLVDSPEPTGSLEPTTTPEPAGSLEPTTTPEPTGSPEPTTTPKPTSVPKPTMPAGTMKPTEKPIWKGWNKTAKGKKYYIQKNGKRAKGYKTIDGDYYFFNSKGFAITKQWKYVKLHGKKYKLYFGKNGKRKLDVTNQLPNGSDFRIEVNLSKNIVMIYAKDGNKGYTIPVKAMVCSVGMPGHRTITGNYYRLRRAGSWHVLRYNSVGQYCTRISGPYLFHSVVYTRYGDKYSLHKAEYRKLGKSASHGCIRLQVEDAKWIYDRAYQCQVSLYYDKTAKYPLKKPKAKKIGKTAEKRYYDPTDPNISEQ